ncbi:hypothetical protein A2U01_0066388, partial [Trifolium medium]|nr:hypothetical protein [Trifolium medium]
MDEYSSLPAGRHHGDQNPARRLPD